MTSLNTNLGSVKENFNIKLSFCHVLLIFTEVEMIKHKKERLEQWFNWFLSAEPQASRKKFGGTATCRSFYAGTKNCQSFKSRGTHLISYGTHVISHGTLRFHGTLIGNHCFKVIRSYKNKIGINDWQCLVQTLKCVYQYSSIQVIRRMRLVSCLSTNKLWGVNC